MKFYSDCYRYVENIPGKGYKVITMPYLKSIPEIISESTYTTQEAGIIAMNNGSFN